MKVTHTYMRESVELFRRCGWEAESSSEVVERDQQTIFTRFRYLLRRGQSCFALECLDYPDLGERFFLEIVEHAGMCSPPFPLDSWKNWKEHIEFKYYVLAESAMGLTFTLQLGTNSPEA